MVFYQVKMFSQNVFSARDVQVNSALNDNNAWDSQQYSQPMYSSQNSQMSSMELFSQQKGSIPLKFDQYQRSQSQATEDEPPNYYSKYVNNQPLFPGSAKNNKISMPMQTFIDEQRQNICMKEERDMLQTFINLLKDYTKEVDSSFKNFQNDMESTLQAIMKNMQDGSQRIDGQVITMKQELISILEAKDKETHEKQELNKNISEQSATIKVLETKTGILEQQLDEMKNKESAYVDQKTKLQQLEQKYLQCLSQWNTNQASCLGNTPPLSQHTGPLSGYHIPPLHHKIDPENHSTYTIERPSGPDYRNYSWKAGQRDDIPINNSLPTGLLVNTDIAMGNPNLPSNPQVNPNLSVENSNVPHVVTYLSNPQYSSTPQAGNINKTSHSQNIIGCQPSQANQSYSTPTYSSTTSTNCCKVRYTGSPAPRSCGLKTSRRNPKRPKQSPMAMVKPLVHRPPTLLDDEIFLVDVVDPPERSMESLLEIDRKNSLPDRPTNSAKQTPHLGKFGSNDEKKWRRHEDTVKRKRNSISMLGISSDDSEVQEIENLLREQSRHFAKRTKNANDGTGNQSSNYTESKMGANSSSNNAIKNWIDQEISSNLVVIFSKTYCPYCRRAKNAFQAVGLDEYTVHELDKRDDGDIILDVLKNMTGARTVPRVFINAKFIGGGSEVEALQQKGELRPMLESCGAL